MAGGPIFPMSAVHETAGKTFPRVYDGWEGLGVMASLDANAVVSLKFQMPPSALPSGTGKLRLICIANATSGTARINPKWASVAAGEDGDPTPTAEGVTPTAVSGAAGSGDTVTWGTGDADQVILVDYNLDADTLVAGEVVTMDLTFETASWSLAVPLLVIPMIVWI